MRIFDVIASNGEIEKRIAWLDANPEGIMYDLVLRKGSHITLHKDGSMWATQDGIEGKEKIAQYQPFNNFKESALLTSFTFVQDITQLEAPISEKIKSKLVVMIDTGLYSSNEFIICEITIIEPKRYDIIKRMELRGRKIYVYSDYVPWIAISIYGISLPEEI